jgi:hypothetical protein
MSKFSQIDVTKINTISIEDRISKVAAAKLAAVHRPGATLAEFLQALPDILKGADLRELVGHVAAGRRRGKPFIWMMGAHVIKCGLAPVVIDLIRRDIITAVAVNGAGIIHDTELAYWGRTSEDVAANLDDGTFGMARETAALVNQPLDLDGGDDFGLGEILGRKICEDSPKFRHLSILAAAYENDVPVTVHVALGTDIVHQHGSADGRAIGERSMRDFRILADIISSLGDGGVVVNVGSSVILPEVFLKALTVARNLGPAIADFYTADFDMLNHYRPRMNVVQRPTSLGGRGFQFTGHHEIMIPLLAAAIIEALHQDEP